MALPRSQKLSRVFSTSPRPIVEDDNLRTGFQVVTPVSPKVGLFGFAAAGIELGATGVSSASMGQKETVISELCKELGITKPTLYRYLAPNGALRDYGKRVLGR